MTRKRKLAYNTISAVSKEIVIVVCGFILPRYILQYFGSETNGLVSSIAHFLGFISFLEMGIGPVIKSNLYKPLADKNDDEVSKIIVSAERFFRRIAYIFLAYIAVLFFIFPQIESSHNGILYTGSLLLIISVSTFAQYFFGITYQLLLNADQKAYVQNSLQLVTIILNTVVSVVLMKLGFSIHIVKLATASIFVIRPLGQMLYVHRKYNLNKKIEFEGEPIKQKWNGFAQHLGAVVVANTDVVVLTLLSTLQNVSIYTVYFNVVSGIKTIVATLTTGIESLWGNMLANEEYEKLKENFSVVETAIHIIVTFLFTVTGKLIIPFIQVYTKGINDTNYIVPVFGFIIVMAYASLSLRLPYFMIVLAAGHYKQTQNASFIQVGINLILSFALVAKFGLNGVAAGTLAAMLYHTTYFALYLRKNILNIKFSRYILHLLIDAVCAVVCIFATKWIQLADVTYSSWFLMALKVSGICFVIVMAVNAVVYRKNFAMMKKMLKVKRGS